MCGKLRDLLSSLNIIRREYALKLNAKKTKYMVIIKSPVPCTELPINYEVVESVEKLNY